MKAFWIGIIVVIIVLVAGILVFRNKSYTSPSSTTTQSTTNRPASTAAASSTSAVTITYDTNGFQPSLTTVKTGSSITFVNNSSSNIQVDSDPHPIHTDDEDLNIGLITPGQSKTVTLTKTGSFGFHNHLQPGNTAKITIE